MTLDGHFTEYPLSPGSFPNRIVVPDGALWFTELFGERSAGSPPTASISRYRIILSYDLFVKAAYYDGNRTFSVRAGPP